MSGFRGVAGTCELSTRVPLVNCPNMGTVLDMSDARYEVRQGGHLMRTCRTEAAAVKFAGTLQKKGEKKGIAGWKVEVVRVDG